mgnify:CR=1 FL=1
MSHLVLALHGHLPFIHHPEHDRFLEEDWLFEGVADCYLPLLQMLDGWERDGVDASCTIGLSPPLLSMLDTPLLRERTVRALGARVSLASRYLSSLSSDNPFRSAVQFSLEENGRALDRFERARRDLPAAFAHHHHGGRVELMTCGATHGLMPVLLDEASLEAQVNEAVKTHRRVLGFAPRGMWLPECGVTPMAFPILARHGIVFTFVEDRAVRFAWPPPVKDVYRPLFTPEGVAVFPRDPVAAKEVWSADEGYPGDHRYREFYKDLGYDAPDDMLDDVHKQGTGAKKQLGVKLHKITGKVDLGEKLPYVPKDAAEAARTHGAHFAARRVEEARAIAESHETTPCFTTTFDAELFGHWWHEGPQFLDHALRALAAHDDARAPRPVSAYRYLEEQPTQQVSRPAVSSWGDAAAFKVWVNEKNDWMWRKIFDARFRLSDALSRPAVDGRMRRAMKQATREVMLAQSSDWPFILTMGTQTGYATRRPLTHLTRAHRLLHMIESGVVDEADLAQIEERDRIFPDVDVSPFQR